MSDLPPLQLHASPRAKPVRVHQPVSILYHWGKQVKAEYPCAQNPECPPAPVHETLSAPVHKTLSALNLEDHMETAILGVEKDQLSKRFRAGLRTQPDQADTVTRLETERCIMGTAMASLASLSLDMENPIHTAQGMSQI